MLFGDQHEIKAEVFFAEHIPIKGDHAAGIGADAVLLIVDAEGIKGLLFQLIVMGCALQLFLSVAGNVKAQRSFVGMNREAAMDLHKIAINVVSVLLGPDIVHIAVLRAGLKQAHIASAMQIGIAFIGAHAQICHLFQLLPCMDPTLMQNHLQ